MIAMSHKQRQLLDYIKATIADRGVSPSFDEMADAIGLKAKSGVHRYITQLEDRGLISRRSGCSRSINVVDRAEEMAFFETLPSGIRHIIRTIAIRERCTNETVMREWIRERAESFRTPYAEQLSA
jgi:SOS-response transcriptional repressor LexA